jgi:hypothetical protein
MMMYNGSGVNDERWVGDDDAHNHYIACCKYHYTLTHQTHIIVETGVKMNGSHQQCTHMYIKVRPLHRPLYFNLSFFCGQAVKHRNT